MKFMQELSKVFETKALKKEMQNLGYSSTVKKRFAYDRYFFNVSYSVGSTQKFHLDHFSVYVDGLGCLFDYYFIPEETKIPVKKLLNSDNPDTIASYLIRNLDTKDFINIIKQFIDIGKDMGKEELQKNIQKLLFSD